MLQVIVYFATLFGILALSRSWRPRTAGSRRACEGLKAGYSLGFPQKVSLVLPSKLVSRNKPRMAHSVRPSLPFRSDLWLWLGRSAPSSPTRRPGSTISGARATPRALNGRSAATARRKRAPPSQVARPGHRLQLDRRVRDRRLAVDAAQRARFGAASSSATATAGARNRISTFRSTKRPCCFPVFAACRAVAGRRSPTIPLGTCCTISTSLSATSWAAASKTCGSPSPCCQALPDTRRADRL